MWERDAFTFLYPWGVPDSDTNPAVRTYRDTLAATFSNRNAQSRRAYRRRVLHPRPARRVGPSYRSQPRSRLGRHGYR